MRWGNVAEMVPESIGISPTSEEKRDYSHMPGFANFRKSRQRNANGVNFHKNSLKWINR